MLMKKKMLTISGVLLAALVFSGCTGGNTPQPTASDAPLTSTAQGLGERKMAENLYLDSQFEQIYNSTKGAVSFETLDLMEWKVERVLQAPEGEKLPAGDNFRATAKANFSYNDTVKAWVEELKKDGWKAENEVVPKPIKDEALVKDTKEDYRLKPYSVDLSKGKTTVKVKIENGTITITINSQ